ncbi:complex I intermediate-associated protein 30-domain-containing protein [Gaertneriomyces semiglobifer]|nr:complex I intermediate-associated protein 30-domain-containing protein [Gaertneriomyces semiglobifer]
MPPPAKPSLGHGLRVLSSYFRRSWDYISDQSSNTIKFSYDWKSDLPMYKLNSVEALQDWVVGSDADIGGLSEAFWGLTNDRTALFWGKISTEIPQGAKLDRSGYAGIRSKEKQLTLFHRPRWDTSLYRYLAIRARGDTRQWFVNLQTDSMYPTYLWQHRLYFKNPGEWETIMIPFRDFVLTSQGYVQKRQLAMDRTKIKTVGFSIVRQPGDFSLELDWIKAINTPRTFGDYDVLDKGEYLDQQGNLRRLKEGQDLKDVLGTRVRVWDGPEKSPHREK